MLLRSSWFPTKIPVSLVLLPIFWLVLAISPNLHQWRSLWVLIIVYGFLFAAVNGFDNYFAEGKTTQRKIFFLLSVVLYLVSVALSFYKVSPLFAAFITIYGIIAFTYSYPLIRWKRYEGFAWALSGFIQGLYMFVLLYIGVNRFSLENIDQVKILVPGILISVVLWAFYPLIYKPVIHQREASSRHNVRSVIFHRLFLLSLELFTIAIVFAGFYFNGYINWVYFPPLLIFYLTGVLFLYLKFLPEEFQFLNFVAWISVIGLNGFFFYVFTDYTNILQLI